MKTIRIKKRIESVYNRKKLDRATVIVYISLLTIMVLLTLPEVVSANSSTWTSHVALKSEQQDTSSWMDHSDRDKTIYGSTSTDKLTESQQKEKKIGSLNKQFGAWVFDNFGEIREKFVTNDLDLSIDGVILGRMSSNQVEDKNGNRVNYAQFDLNKGNPWGIIGAILYVTFRQIMWGSFLILFIVKLTIQFFRNTSKGRAELKTILTNAVLFFAWIAFAPHLTDILIYVRDVFMYVTNRALTSQGGLGVSSSLMDAFEENYNNWPSTFNALLYGASIGSGLFFFFNYLGTAILQMFFFGGNPIVSLLSVNDSKKFMGWNGAFFLNLFIPLIDSIAILVPLLLQSIYISNTGHSGSLVINIIMLSIIWSTIPTRTIILGQLGARMGIQQRNGMLGLAAMGMMAARALGGLGRLAHRRIGGSRDNGGGKSSSSREDRASADLEHNKSEIYRESNRDAASKMPEIDEFLSDDKMAETGGSRSHEKSSESGEFSRGDDLQGRDPVDIMNEEADKEWAGISNGEFSHAKGEETTFESAGNINNGTKMGSQSDLSNGGETSKSGIDAIGGNEGNNAIRNTTVAESAGNVNGRYMERNISGTQTGRDASGDKDVAHEKGNIETGIGLREIGATDKQLQSTADSKPYTGQQRSIGERLPGYDSKFAESLSEEDKDRYTNLVARDAMKDKLHSNESRINELKEMDTPESIAEQTGAEQKISALTERNQQIDSEMEGLGREQQALKDEQAGMMANPGNIDFKRSADISQRTSEIQKRMGELSSEKESNNGDLRSLQGKQAEARERRQEIRELEGQNKHLSQGIAASNEAENSFSANSRAAGMSGQRFESASDFKAKQRMDQNQKTLANYKNFDSGDFKDILTPQEKEAFYRQRAHHTRVSQVTRGIGTVAGIAAGTVAATGAAALATYGGPSAMASAALGGGMSIGTATGAATSLTSRAVYEGTRVATHAGVETARKAKQYFDNRPRTTGSNATTKNTAPYKGQDMLNQFGQDVKQYEQQTKQNAVSPTQGYDAADMLRMFGEDVEKYHQ